jgi:hypothetical protein
MICCVRLFLGYSLTISEYVAAAAIDGSLPAHRFWDRTFSHTHLVSDPCSSHQKIKNDTFLA